MRYCVIDVKDTARYRSNNTKNLGLNSNSFFAFGDSAGGQIAQILLFSNLESFEGAKDLIRHNYNLVAGIHSTDLQILKM